MNSTIKAYGLDTGALNIGKKMPDIPRDHVFVVSDQGHDWRCFGRGKAHIAKARLLTTTQGSAEWINALNGADGEHATGLVNQVSGVCHNVANRLLLVADADVADARGKGLATLAFGRYGFELEDFAQRIADTAKQIETVSDAQLEKALCKLNAHLNDELADLAEDLMNQFNLNTSSLPCSTLGKVRDLYGSFHDTRRECYLEASQAEPEYTNNTDVRYLKRLEPELHNFLYELKTCLGDSAYTRIIPVLPEQAGDYLKGLSDSTERKQ